MDITISKAEINNVASFAYLFDEYRVFYKQPSDIQGAINFLKERIEQNESVIFIAWLQDKAVGFTQLYPIFSSVSMKRTWLLNDLFVAETYRGNGIASRLLQFAQAFGEKTNSKWLLLQTAIDNFAAQKVYEKNGWKKDDAFYSYYFTF